LSWGGHLRLQKELTYWYTSASVYHYVVEPFSPLGEYIIKC
jgi:hypothetical protein